MAASSNHSNFPALQGLQGARLHEGIVLRLRDLIRQGELRHGSRLPPERALAEQFGVGRSSVREAIRSLELQGLVVTRHGSGSFVDTQSLDAVATLMAPENGSGGLADIFEMRHLLEPQIAALAAPSSHGRRHRASGNNPGRAEAPDHGRGDLCGRRHRVSLHPSDSDSQPGIGQGGQRGGGRLARSRDRYLQRPGRPERSLHSHHEILEMVRVGDDAGARRAMTITLRQWNPPTYPTTDSKFHPHPNPPPQGEGIPM